MFVKKPMKLYQDTLYSFSEKKVKKLVQYEPFAFLFKHFMEKGGLKKAFEENTYFKSNREAYESRVDEILTYINQRKKN